MILTAVNPTPAERPASAISALTTFLLTPVPTQVQYDPITIHFRNRGQWNKVQTSRNNVDQDLSKIRQEYSTLNLQLFKTGGCGIVHEDIAGLDDICLTTGDADRLSLEIEL